jgi:immune inhibitor A
VNAALAFILAVGLVSSGNAAPHKGNRPGTPRRQSDSLAHPLGDRQRDMRQKALEQVLKGQAVAQGKNKVVQVAKGQYVELARAGEEKIWTILAEFGTQVDPFRGGSPGPLHNQIPQPDRSVNSTDLWVPDFNRTHYEEMLFSEAPGALTMRNYYIEQSSNRYTVNGVVTDWVRVPFNEAYYGSNYCGSLDCQEVVLFVRDSANAWYNAQIAAGKSPAQIEAELAQFDVWDRYDYDGDGNFNEPDGYIDHFQAIHAGMGEDAGGGAQGTDAIWSHRWYVFIDDIGSTGPDGNKLGGTQVGNTKYWIGDYTTEPEDGTIGVFTHEFGHDLGLPDLYDTSGNTGGAMNSTGFWTLMSFGSFNSNGITSGGLGTRPAHMSAYEKIFLGWSNLQVVNYGQGASLKLGPAEYNTKQAQQLLVLLPDKNVETNIGSAYAGSYFYYSGSGNNLDHSMTKVVALPAGTVTLTAKVRYDIEQDWDYAYLTVNGVPVTTSLSSEDSPHNQNFGHGITGSSGGNWVDLTADLSAFSGQTVTIGLRYWTDVAVVGTGFGIDEIAITGSGTDGAESDNGWTYAGFVRSNGIIAGSFFNAYIAEYRQYTGFDEALKTGPYNYGFDDPVHYWTAEYYPYQDGLLVWYYDTSFDNNNVGEHCAGGRCGGLYLPVDAHPELLLQPNNGLAWYPNVQSYDATFGLEPTDRITLHRANIPGSYGGLPAVPEFNDNNSYWVEPNPSIGHLGWSSVPVPHTGTSIRVVSTSAQGGFMQVQVRFNQ